MKTKEELAKEYAESIRPIDGIDKHEAPYVTAFEHHGDIYDAFMAGYEAAQKWIPVECEKPKANTIVCIIAITETGKRYRTVAYFIPTKTVLADDFLESGYDSEDLQEYDDELDEYWVKEGWFEYQTVAEIHWHISDKITHWLPIPKLPTE